MATNVYNLFKQGVQTAQKGMAVLSKPEVIEPLKKKNVKRVTDTNLKGGKIIQQPSRPEFGTNIAPLINNRLQVNKEAQKAINYVGNKAIEGIESGVKTFTGIGNMAGDTVSSPFKTTIKSTSEFLKPYTDGVLKSIAPVKKVVNDLGASTIPLGKPIVEGLDQGTQSIRDALGAFMGMVNQDKQKFELIQEGKADPSSPEFKVYSIVKEKAGERGVETYESFKKNAEKLNEENPDLFREGLKTYIKSAGTFVDILERPIRKTVLPWYYYGMVTLADTVDGQELTPERLKRNQLMAEYVSGGRLDGVSRLFGAGIGMQVSQLPDSSLMGDMIRTETGTRADVAKELGQLYGVSKDEIHQAWNDSTLFGMPVLSVLDTITSYASSIGEAMLAPSFIQMGAQFNSPVLTKMGQGLEFGSKLVYPTAVGTTALDMGMRFLSPDKAQGLYEYLADNEDLDLQQDIQVMGGIATLGTLFKVVGKVMPSSKPLSLLDQVKVMQDAINKVNTDPELIKTMLGQFKKDYELQVDYLMRPEAGKQGALTINDLHKLDDVIKQLPPEIQKGLQDVQMKLFYSSFEEDWVGGYALSQAKKLGLNIDTLRRTLDDFKSGKKGEVEANETLIHEIGHLASSYYKSDPEWEGIVKQTQFGIKGKYMFTNPGELFAEGLRKFYRAPEMLKAEAPKLYEFMDKVSKEITDAFQNPIMKLEGQPVEAMGRMKKIDEELMGQKIPPELEPLAKEARKYKSAEEFVRTKVNAYHGTLSAAEASGKFKVEDDIGIHFGTKEQAADRLYFKTDGGVDGSIVEAHVNIKNPLNLLDDANDWTNPDLVLSTIKTSMEGLPKDSYNFTLKELNKLEGKSIAELRAFLQKKGYDGITYMNYGEAEGFHEALSKGKEFDEDVMEVNESMIAFSPKQIQTKEQLTDLYNQATGKEFMPRVGKETFYHYSDTKYSDEVLKPGAPHPQNYLGDGVYLTNQRGGYPGEFEYQAKVPENLKTLDLTGKGVGENFAKKVAKKLGINYEPQGNALYDDLRWMEYQLGQKYGDDLDGNSPRAQVEIRKVVDEMTKGYNAVKAPWYDPIDGSTKNYELVVRNQEVPIIKDQPEFMPRMGGDVPKGEIDTYEPLTPSGKQGERQMATKYYNLTPEGVETLKNLRKLMGIETYKKRTFEDIDDIAKMLSSDPKKLIQEVNTKRITADEVEGLKKTIKTSIEFISQAKKELATSIDPKALELKMAQVDGVLQSAVRKLAIGNTETARALVANRILSTDATDPAFWIYRAEKVTEGKLTPTQRAAIIQLAGNKDQLGMASFVTALQRPDWAEKAITFWKAGLLSSPSTHIRNIGSTATSTFLDLIKDIPTVAVDKLASMVTGKRTVAFADVSDVWKGVKKGYFDAQDVLKYGMSEGEAFRGEIRRQVHYDNPVIDKYVNTIFRALGAEDKVFKGIAYEVEIGRIAKAQAMNENLKGDAFKARVDELKAKPTPEMAAEAEKASLYVTFNKENILADKVASFKRTDAEGKMTLPRAVGKAAIETTMPFVRTPTNVAGAVVDYSPAGLIKTIYNLTKGNQKAFVENFGRNVTGTGFIVLGHYLASQGMFYGVYPNGGDEKKKWQARGYRAGDLVIGDQRINLMGFSPAGNLLQLGAAFYDVQQTEPELYNQLVNTAMNGIKGLTEQTFLLGVSRTLSAITQPEQYAGRWSEGLVSGMVPTIIRQLAEASDKYQRETNGILDSIKYSLPGLRQTLPPRRDVLGQPIRTTGASLLGDTSGFFERALLKMFDPTQSSTVNTSPLFDEYERLQEVGIQNAFPSVPTDSGTYSKTVYVNGEKYSLKAKYKMDSETYNLFRKVQGKMMAIASLEALESPEYQLMNDEDKAATLDEFYRKSVEIAKDFVLPVMMEKDPQFSADVKNQMNSFGATEIPKMTSIDVQKILAKHKSEGPPTPKIKVESEPNISFQDEFKQLWDKGAFGSDPLSALQVLLSEEKLKDVRGGAVIMERMGIAQSESVKENGGAQPTDRLDHTIPLELGGSNAWWNLKIVTEEEWASYTPVENFLGDLLNQGKLKESEAQFLIRGFKDGWITSDQIFSMEQSAVKKPLLSMLQKMVPKAKAAGEILEPDEEWYTDNEFMAAHKTSRVYDKNNPYKSWEPVIGAKITHISDNGTGPEFIDDKGRFWSFVKGEGTKWGNSVWKSGYIDWRLNSRRGPPRQMKKPPSSEMEIFSWKKLP